MQIRCSEPADRDAVWAVLEPVFREGETYPVARDVTKDDALAYWFGHGAAVFVAEADGGVLGSYYLRPNTGGGGAHVANCGYAVAPAARGKGVGRALLAHSLEEARRRGFKAMQYNLVIATNERAIALWKSGGFEIVGRLPEAFDHPSHGLVDALVMYRAL